ncbi:MAG: sodium:solute symporter [Verrucomicrobiota bacterium]
MDLNRMSAPSNLDYGIIAVYFLITLCIGVWTSRKTPQNFESYFLAGRSLPWWMLGISGMTNWFDLTGTMLITSFLYMMGPRGLFIEFRGGAVLTLAFLIAYTAKWHRRSGCITSAEWISFRFGTDRPAEFVRITTALTGILMIVSMIAYQVRGCLTFVGFFVPHSPVTTTLFILVVCGFYTLRSGLYGIVFTDLIKGVVILIACLVISWLAWQKSGSLEELQRLSNAVTGNPNWTSSLPSFHTSMPEGYKVYEDLFMMMAFYLICNVFIGLGSGAEPKFFAAKNDWECTLQSLLRGITLMFRWPMMISFAMLGLFLVNQWFPHQETVQKSSLLIHQYFPDLKESEWHQKTDEITNHPRRFPIELVQTLENQLGPEWQKKLHLIGYRQTINPERILPAVIMEKTPHGVKGLILAAMLAAFMSSIATQINSAGAFFANDLFPKLFKKKPQEKNLILASSFFSIFVVLAGFWMGKSANNINYLWGWIVMGVTTGMVAPRVLRLYWWRFNAWGSIAGMLVGGGGAIIQRLFNPDLPEWKQFLIMISLSFAGSLGGSLLTKPTPQPILENFYRKTRPFGFWKPIEKCLDDQALTQMRKENHRDQWTVPFALLAQITLFLIPMELLIKDYISFWKTLPLFLLGLGWLWFFGIHRIRLIKESVL